MTELTNAQAHRIARERGFVPWVYRVLEFTLFPLLRLVFGLRVLGADNVPKSGAALIAPNHKSYWDGFVLAAALPRRACAMGKAEAFRGLQGRFILALGGFPVRRGESDAEAMITARTVLARGDLLVVFPEGTLYRDAATLGPPKRGAARLAIESGAPLVPVAIVGLDKRRLHLPRSVQVSFGEPISVADLEASPDAAGEITDNVVWPSLEREYHRLRARPGLIAAGIAAVGLGIALKRRGRDR